jgi:GNAT superfamily N-acetyltransferase
MPDMLVRLYEIPDLEPALAACQRRGIVVRGALAPERAPVRRWLADHFPYWREEVDATFCRMPITCIVAVRDRDVLGFACYDAIRRNFFGPTGVVESERGTAIGRALLLAALHAQRADGYAYAIIGGVGPDEYYAKAVGATLIDGSTPGIYGGLLF